MTTKFLIIFLLLALSFLTSAAEVALYASNSVRGAARYEMGGKRLKSPQTFLSTILVTNSVANFLFALYAASLTLDLSRSLALDRTLTVPLEIVIVTSLLIFLADAVPKIVASNNPRLINKISMPLVSVLTVVEAPIVLPLNALLARVNSHRRRPSVTIDNEGLKVLSKIAGNAGVLEEHEADLLRKIAFLGEKTVKDAMTLRTGIVSIPTNSTFDEVVDVFQRSEHSRLPVHDGSLENIIGMLYAREFLPIFRKKGSHTKFDVRSLMRQPIYVPETQSLEMLLETFKMNRLHIAVVVDEFGGLAGIVTLSDVVREIFGSSAEMPRENSKAVRIGEDTYMAGGGVRLDDLASEVGGLDFGFDPVDTVSALLIERYGEVPRVGNKMKIGSFEFEVEQATPKAILQVRVRQLYSGSVAKDG